MQLQNVITFISDHPHAAIISVVCAAAVNILIAFPSIRKLYHTLGLHKSSLVILLLSLFAYAFEGQALLTAWPYGEFHYTPVVGPLLFNFIPVLLPLSWVPLALGCFAVGVHATQLLLQRSPSLPKKARTLLIVSIGTLAIVATDFVLDPVAAQLGFWVWQDKTGFYGVPWSNFVGWAVSGATAISILEMLHRHWKAVVSYQLTISLRIFIVFWTVLAVATQLLVVASIGIVLTVLLQLLASLVSQDKNSI